MLKAIKVVSVIAVASILALMFWLRYARYQTTELSRAFYRELAQTDTLFDLRKVGSLDWDEVVFWSPYGNICDYGIEGFSPGSPSCKDSTDDGECYLLFLRQNRLVGKVAIDRKRIDLTRGNLRGRIPKSKAVFRLLTKSPWPATQLAE